MGDRQAAGRRVRRRRGRARGHALDLRGRRREAVDLLVPGRGAARSSTTMQRHFAARASRRPSCASRDVKFQYSFRSAPIVLDAVDTVFSTRAGVRGPDRRSRAAPCTRRCARNAPGVVELWPLIEPDEKPEIEGWDAPFDETQETSPRVRLARRIATHACGPGSSAATRSATATSAARCGRATSWCWCASAARCSRRSSAR